jgi:hypothetical protein
MTQELPARSRPRQLLPEADDYLEMVQNVVLKGLSEKEDEIKFYLPGLIERAYTIVHRGEPITFSFVPSEGVPSGDVKGEGV